MEEGSVSLSTLPMTFFHHPVDCHGGGDSRSLLPWPFAVFYLIQFNHENALIWSSWLCLAPPHAYSLSLFSKNPVAFSFYKHIISALKCSFILFLKLNFLLPCKLLSPESGWPLRVLFLLASCNTYFKMRKSKKSQLTKTLRVEGMTQNRAGNPWLSALCKLPKISLFIYRAFSAGSC